MGVAEGRGQWEREAGRENRTGQQSGDRIGTVRPRGNTVEGNGRRWIEGGGGEEGERGGKERESEGGSEWGKGREEEVCVGASGADIQSA